MPRAPIRSAPKWYYKCTDLYLFFRKRPSPLVKKQDHYGRYKQGFATLLTYPVQVFTFTTRRNTLQCTASQTQTDSCTQNKQKQCPALPLNRIIDIRNNYKLDD
ncbi:hypothetical protein TcasGA2_TC003090 [Tribolium castaneum]|uniref:Uncharacterized protein n=1 Tax=Tribolium castaneum TaxID=7070 RepID=D6WFE6_TRICA|nr:hypothetical protein TcasGA2_TC003090 [Tribolium castaneum]